MNYMYNPWIILILCRLYHNPQIMGYLGVKYWFHNIYFLIYREEPRGAHDFIFKIHKIFALVMKCYISIKYKEFK